MESLAVGEKERVCGGVLLADLAGLADEATVDHRSLGDLATGGDDEVARHHVRAQLHWSVLVTVHATVEQLSATVRLRAVAKFHVHDLPAVADHDGVADVPHVRGDAFGIFSRQFLEVVCQLRAVAVERHHVGGMGGEQVEDRHLTSATLVQGSDHGSVTKRTLLRHRHHIHVLDVRIVTDLVVGDVVAHTSDVDVVAHDAVVERGVRDARMAGYAALQIICFIEGSHPDLSREDGESNPRGVKAVRHLNIVPIIRITAL